MKKQSPSSFVSVVLRAELEPEPLTRAVTAAVHEVDKDQVVSDVRTLERIKSDSAATNRVRTTLLAVFAMLAVARRGSTRLRRSATTDLGASTFYQRVFTSYFLPTKSVAVTAI